MQKSRKQKLNILKKIFGSCRHSHQEHLFQCPQCNHHKLKLSVNLDKNVFKCWVCDYRGKNVYRLVKKYGDFNDCREWPRDEDKVDITEFDKIILQIESEGAEPITDLPDEFEPLSTSHIEFASIQARRYLKDRGVTNDQILKWKIGFCKSGEYEGRVVIPSFNLDGDVNYYVTRSYTGDWRKYKNSPLSKNKMIFNELFLDFSKEIIITEGVFDSIVAGDNSVPLLGSTLSEKSKLFWEIVKNDTSVYIGLDANVENKSLYIIDKLLKYDIEVYKIDTTGYDDIGSMSRRVFNQRKDEAEFMSSHKCMIKRAMML
jgi:DNA primase